MAEGGGTVPRRKAMEMEHKELMAFAGTLVAAVVFAILNKYYPHYALTIGAIITITVLLILLFKTLERKGVFGKNMTYVWMALVFGLTTIFSTLLNQGYLPFWFYASVDPMAITVVNGLIYTLIIVTAAILVYVAYVYKTGNNPIKQRLTKASLDEGYRYFKVKRL